MVDVEILPFSECKVIQPHNVPFPGCYASVPHRVARICSLLPIAFLKYLKKNLKSNISFIQLFHGYCLHVCSLIYASWGHATDLGIMV